MDYNDAIWYLATVVVGAPCSLLVLLGAFSLIDRPLSERTISRLVTSTVGVGLGASLAIGAIMFIIRDPHITVYLGSWVSVPHFHFSVKLLFDTLSLPFLLLSFVLCGTVGAFTSRYLHREPGFNRFYVLYALFMLGMVIASLAGTIETLFAGWEMVGLSSALLVAFFHERPSPVRNGLRVWTVYRVSDAALLTAAVLLHHVRGQGDFDALLGMGGDWPEGHANISAQQALIVGMLLLLAAAGKSALVPFSGWLPRAMEGPTPSSAIFYGSLSVHLGAYMLLRVTPILDLSVWLSATVVGIGLLTALFGAITSRAQTDIKCALSFASVTQVGLIVAEIGLGLRWIPLAHIIGHACLRTLQFLRAPSLLYDYKNMENAIGNRLPRISGIWLSLLPESGRVWVYRFALERGYMDSLLVTYIVRPFLAVFRFCDAVERKWTKLFSGPAPVKPHHPVSNSRLMTLDELLPTGTSGVSSVQIMNQP
jgi:NADH-quinone oxidoreductase subunit L